ncbi:type I restriction enzyme, S subunit [Enterococcus sp. AZ119]|uniref:restriction endonuclease subunit S n=1 Tax=Enterococcus sp. AZ119 TaxID=2774940 RepID=UPI003D2FD7A3
MKKVPRLRFRGFQEDWELCKLGEESDVRDGTHDSPKYFDDGYPLVTSKNLKDFGLDLSDVSLISYKDFKSINKRSKVDIGDILFGMIGTIGNPVQIFRDDFAIKNVALIKEQRKILNGFLIHILKSPVFDRYIRNENAGGTQKFLALSKVRGFEFLRPNIEEQVRIGNLFKQIDNTITLHQRKLDQLKELKKAYLKAMLISMNTKNNKVPKLRFADFEGEWDQRKFKAFSKKTGKKNSQNLNYPAYSVSNKSGLISQSEQFNGNRLDTLEKHSYKIVEPYEFAYNPARINVGSIAFNTLGKPVIVSSLYVVLQMEDNLNNDFILQFIKSPAFVREVKRNTEGSVREYLFYENFANIKFPYTKNIKEQQKIGAFFKKSDDTIALRQNKLNQLKALKKAYLQNMFI